MPPSSTPRSRNPLRALKVVASKVGGSVSRAGSSGGVRPGSLSPQQGEAPVAFLRVQVVGAKGLESKDRNGFSDPFVVVVYGRERGSTPVVKKTLDPEFPAEGSTFNLPLYRSLANRVVALEAVVWDKDMLKKDYLGEIGVSVEDWFPHVAGGERAVAWDDPLNGVQTHPLVTTRKSAVSGELYIKLGLVPPPAPAGAKDAAAPALELLRVYHDLLQAARSADGAGIMSAPALESIGTSPIEPTKRGKIPSFSMQESAARAGEGGLEDDALESDEEDSEDEDSDSSGDSSDEEGAADDSTATTPTPVPSLAPPSGLEKSSAASSKRSSRIFGLLTPGGSKREANARADYFDSASASASGASTPAPVAPAPAPAPEGKRRRRKFKRTKKAKTANVGKAEKRAGGGYSLGGVDDVLGIVLLEVRTGEDLPRLKNMTRLGWDMDPFVVVSFGKKIFRTRVIRHSLNPTWDEKLYFHVRKGESAYTVGFSVLDWDKLSSNDHVGDATLMLEELIARAPKPDRQTGLYHPKADEEHDMKEFKLPLKIDEAWEDKHKPVLTIRAKYQPYALLRQHFWRSYVVQYDADDTGSISRVELTTMLDSLGSTLTASTIDSFFTRFGKDPHGEEITIDELVQVLEEETTKPEHEKKRLDEEPPEHADRSGPPTPSLSGTPALGAGAETPLSGLDFSGPVAPAPEWDERLVAAAAEESKARPDNEPNTVPVQPSSSTPSAPGTPLPAVTVDGQGAKPMTTRTVSGASSSTSPSPSPSASDLEGETETDEGAAAREQVINIRVCPLCHKGRMSKKAEVDIISHLAVCASTDWGRLNRMAVSNYVTASQAQRKWISKIASKITTGQYSLGANSANILVQDRLSGQLQEEKMQMYVRIGIRMLYKGARSKMEGPRARRLLKSMSIKQGIKYDDPESARDIPNFIAFHNLNVAEILDPLGSFKTFNEFFYRKLKDGARPVEAPEDPSRLVSCADCRMMAFETSTEATRIWIKGRDFTVGSLLGDAYKDRHAAYEGGALGIFRLAPQDYHRFHSPVDGKIGKINKIEGEYYTVNPQAVRSPISIFTDNVRMIVPFHTERYGTVMAVCIGAMMVGSILLTVEEGQTVKRGEEFGYFAFGGSTIVLVFEKGACKWDDDLVVNSRASLETLVRMGMGVGRLSPPSSSSASSA